MGKLEELQAEVDRLKSALDDSNRKKSHAEEMAQMMVSIGESSTEEQPTGRTVDVDMCVNPAERDAKKHKFKVSKVPTFFYNIQLPAGAGVSLSTNGVEYYHGQTYEFTLYELAAIKDRVARCWAHEKSIHGENENAYKKPTHTHLMTTAAMMRGR